MKEKIKFIHSADIHLGANPFEIEERFDDMGKALDQVCNFAVDNQVDFVIIAGDFFHNKALNAKTLEQAINSLEKLKNANIPVFLTEGNHDMETYSNVYSWLQFLSSRNYIYLLRPNKIKTENLIKMWDEEKKEGTVFETENCYIIGLGYPGSTAAKYIENINTELKEMISKKEIVDKPIICMLHTGINRFLTEAMGGLREEEIESLLEKVDYLALGHIHTRYENPEKKYFNPGSIECVRITDDPFNKGFYYINMDIDSKKIESEFKIVETRNSILLDLNLDGIKDDEECEDFIVKSVKEEYEKKCLSKSKIMLQIKLNGTLLINSIKIDISKIKSKIEEQIPVLHQEIINLVKYVSESELIVTNDVSREEIDKIVIENKILKSGFEENKVKSIYGVIEKMKEYGNSESLELDGAYGQELEDMLLKIIKEN